MAALAAVHGFVVDDDVPPLEGGTAFGYAGKDAAELSQAIRAALDDGLVLLSMAPAMRTLESVLEETVHDEQARALASAERGAA